MIGKYEHNKFMKISILGGLFTVPILNRYLMVKLLCQKSNANYGEIDIIIKNKIYKRRKLIFIDRNTMLNFMNILLVLFLKMIKYC